MRGCTWQLQMLRAKNSRMNIDYDGYLRPFMMGLSAMTCFKTFPKKTNIRHSLDTDASTVNTTDNIKLGNRSIYTPFITLTIALLIVSLGFCLRVLFMSKNKNSKPVRSKNKNSKPVRSKNKNNKPTCLYITTDYDGTPGVDVEEKTIFNDSNDNVDVYSCFHMNICKLPKENLGYFLQGNYLNLYLNGDVNAIVLEYNVFDKSSYAQLDDLIKFVKTKCGERCSDNIMILANGSDSSRGKEKSDEVDISEAREKYKEYKIFESNKKELSDRIDDALHQIE